MPDYILCSNINKKTLLERNHTTVSTEKAECIAAFVVSFSAVTARLII